MCAERDFLLEDRIHPNANQDVIDGEPTSLKVARAVERLRLALAAEYGVDYAFMVAGRGRVLAASTMRDGTIQPRVQQREGAASWRS